MFSIGRIKYCIAFADRSEWRYVTVDKHVRVAIPARTGI